MSSTPLSVVEVMPAGGYDPTTNEFDYGLISDPGAREWAETAAGMITFGLGRAVVKVLEAGNLLMQAKHRLPHGEYLPWVERACGLKPSYARKLIQAAEWANGEHVPVLGAVTDTATLFMLSADTTPEDVREWFMERAAAGDVPTRSEVAERKRCATGKPPAPRPVDLHALSLFRKHQVEDAAAAVKLAAQITSVSEAQMLSEVGLRETPKCRVLSGRDADFHRRPDGSCWDRVPHAGAVDVQPERSAELGLLFVADEPVAEDVPIADAAARLGMNRQTLTARLVPSKNPDGIHRNGWWITRSRIRGMVRMERNR